LFLCENPSKLFENCDFTVPVISIDYHVESTGLARIDFIKIDVEGAEDTVIRGMTNTLQVFHPDVLVEIHANDGSESEALDRLQAAGYQLKRVQSVAPSLCDTRARGGYVLAEGAA
jgi:hypothetical protein